LNKGLLAALFSETINPVNAKAQRRVPLPDNLQLDAPINPEAFSRLSDFSMEGLPKNPDSARVCFTHIYIQPDHDDEPIDMLDKQPQGGGIGGGGGSSSMSPDGGGGVVRHHSQEYLGYQVDYEAERAKWQSTPFYLQPSTTTTTTTTTGGNGSNLVNPEDVDIDSIPVIRLTEEDLKGKRHRKSRRRGEGGSSRHRKGGDGSGGGGGDGRVPPPLPVMKDEVMPEGARESGSEDDTPAR